MITHKYLAKTCKKAVHEKTFSVDNIEVLLIDYAKTSNIVVFRGTEFNKTKDWITNILVFPRKTEDCGRVHCGIYKAAKAAITDLRLRLDKNIPVVLTGFSLGGAIAILCGKLLQDHGYKVRIVTFGCPKVVHKYSMKLYRDLNITQYAHALDIVPKQFFGWPWPYDHVNITTIGSGKSPRLTDHDIDKYIELL
ncbi:MAG: lipase family protein [bacterium]